MQVTHVAHSEDIAAEMSLPATDRDVALGHGREERVRLGFDRRRQLDRRHRVRHGARRLDRREPFEIHRGKGRPEGPRLGAVAGNAVGHGLRPDLLEGRRHSPDQRNRAGERRLVVRRLLDVAGEIDVERAVLGVQRRLGARCQVDRADAGRRGQRLLGVGHGEIDPPLVEVKGVTADAGDPVDDEPGVGRRGDVTDRRNRIQHAGARLVVDHRDQIDVVVNGRLDPIEVEGFAPLGGDRPDVGVAFGDAPEPPAELAVLERHDGVIRTDEVRHRRLHRE